MKYCLQSIERLATVERGKFSVRPRNDPRYYGGKYPFIQTGDISQANGVVRNYSQTLNEQGLCVSRLFKKGSLVLTIAANIGDVASVDFDFACPDSVVVLQPKAGIDAIWLKYILQSCKSNFSALATQNAQKNINLEIIRPLQVPTPDNATQKKIASVLHSWDSAIEKTERLIELEKRQFRHLLNRLIVKPSTHWQSYALGDLFDPVTRKNAVGETNVLTSSAEHGLISQLDYYNKNVSAEDVSGYYLINQGDFAYNRSAANGYPYGAIKRLDKYPRGVLSTLYICFAQKGKHPHNADFLSYYFESGVLNAQLAEVCQEGARSHGLLNITRSDFFNLVLYLPSITEQIQAAKMLSSTEREIELLRNILDHLNQQKSFLMSKLLTGEWEAPDLGAEAD